MLSGQQDPKSPYPEDLSPWLELDYHRHVRSLRRRRKWVTLATLAVTVAVATWTVLPGRHTAHEAAPVATAHALFNNDCAQCHTEAWQPLRRLAFGDQVRSVPDATCKTCHDGAAHFDVTHHVETPSHDPHALAAGCAGCHREHRGKANLARVADGHCTACHADLQRVLPGSKRENVTTFAGNHPPFHWRDRDQQLRHRMGFSHASHLQLDLDALRKKGSPEGKASLEGLGTRLECSACHQPDSERRYLRPIRYEQHCANCHPLVVGLAGQFEDPKARAAAEAFRKVPAPHKEPEVVRAVLRERYLRFVRENPVVLSPAPAEEPRRPVPGLDTRTVTEAQWLWAKGKVTEAETRLFAQHQVPAGERLVFDNGAACRQCHKEVTDATRRPGGLPVYETPNVPVRWSSQSVFSHDSHRMLDCVACHETPASKEPAALLLPAVQTCKACHTPAAGARSDCAECHLFHDRRRELAPTTLWKIENSVFKKD